MTEPSQDKFYLGRLFDSQTGSTSDQPLLYDPNDLTTHAVVVGMTGSGKTGLCIDLLEEAALHRIPALLIDPKGDITNALLHFPELRPEDFQPWLDPDQVRREGATPEQAAVEAAESWRSGLAQWGIAPERLAALKNAAHFAVYTPGSTAGLPVSILASFQAPPLPWDTHQELLREKISGTVTALLGLVGLNDVDPVRSREHILLANIFEHAWSQGRDLNLGELILQTQTPPFEKLGVFDVNTFFPEKDRFMLAMLLNNILAAPAFQTWIEGQPLDIPSLLYGPDGRPRHSVFYIAHLSDAERMFFVTLLFSAVEAWMRTQGGTTSLRALLYFDEIFGYLPPVGNPPSKQPMLRMLKQARAFGVGQVLVTQNPVDVDYKALSNAGTWFIGKLQTDQDKQRLLDGLAGAIGGGLDRGVYDRLISSLGKRVFLLHNVHAAQPVLFQTRWAMNFLAGPLTRAQIPALNELAGAAAPAAGAGVSHAPSPQAAEPVLAAVDSPSPASSPPAADSIATRPAVPARVAEYFLPNDLPLTQALAQAGLPAGEALEDQGLVYRPALLAQAGIRFMNRKYGLDEEVRRTALVAEPDRRGLVRWDDFLVSGLTPAELERLPDPRARFVPLAAPLDDAKTLRALESDFVDWGYRTTQISLRANEALQVYAGPATSEAEFRRQCAQAARSGRDQEASKTAAGYDKKIDALRVKLEREQRELSEDQTELSQRKMEELGTHAENLFSLFGGRRRRMSTSLTKRRMTAQAKADVEESEEAIAQFQVQIAQLEEEKAAALRDVNDRWSEIANQKGEISLSPYKKDVLVELFGVAWVPYYRVSLAGAVHELPASASGRM